MTRLSLTRNGQTEWNPEGRVRGSMESSLSQLGRKQARQLGKGLGSERILQPTSLSIVEVNGSARRIVQYGGTDHYQVTIDVGGVIT